MKSVPSFRFFVAIVRPEKKIDRKSAKKRVLFEWKNSKALGYYLEFR